MPEPKRSRVAASVGLITFLGGVGLIIATFWLAQSMFAVEPSDALGIQEGKPLDPNVAMSAGIGILTRIILLIVMAGIGSAVASRGIKLYAQSAESDARKG